MTMWMLVAHTASIFRQSCHGMKSQLVEALQAIQLELLNNGGNGAGVNLFFKIHVALFWVVLGCTAGSSLILISVFTPRTLEILAGNWSLSGGMSYRCEGCLSN